MKVEHGWWCWWRGWDYKLTARGAWYSRTCRRCKKTEDSILGLFLRKEREP
jgi:hypothetical protein